VTIALALLAFGIWTVAVSYLSWRAGRIQAFQEKNNTNPVYTTTMDLAGVKEQDLQVEKPEEVDLREG